jgi:tetratricopeptide (TPR) repeat protein
MRSHCHIVGLLLIPVAHALAADPAPGAPAAPPADLPKQAAAFERKGDKAKAAETYEAIIAQEPGKRLVLAPRLVRLYAETGVTNKALEWAHVAMEHNPDPQAYLAGVHTMLGDTRAAKTILDKEIAAASPPRRQLTLRWQLADVLEKEGDAVAAEKTLTEAAEKVKGTPDEAAATKRLDLFRVKQKGGVGKNAVAQPVPVTPSP